MPIDIATAHSWNGTRQFLSKGYRLDRVRRDLNGETFYYLSKETHEPVSKRHIDRQRPDDRREVRADEPAAEHDAARSNRAAE